jgi:hypothetical protein
MQTRSHHRLYLFASIIFGVLAFVAFARKFYLARLFKAPELSTLLLVHGVVMSGWVILLVTQSALIATGRHNWHRRLGMFGVVWAGMVVVLGSVTTLHAAAREAQNHTAVAPLQLAITGLELVQMALFFCFVAGAIWLRSRGAFHKRLMLLTIVCMLPSVFPRLPFDLFSSNTSILLGTYASLAICVGIDTFRHRRLHPAFAWGGALFAASLQLAFFGAFTPAWQDFLTRMVS